MGELFCLLKLVNACVVGGEEVLHFAIIMSMKSLKLILGSGPLWLNSSRLSSWMADLEAAPAISSKIILSSPSSNSSMEPKLVSASSRRSYVIESSSLSAPKILYAAMSSSSGS